LNNYPVLKQSAMAVGLAIAATQMAAAQETVAPTQTVYITGSNLKRTAKEGTQPIQVITAKDIRDSGAATVTELMRQVPSMGSDMNLDNTGGTGFARGASTASLRGLSSTSTLILLNGRRMTPSAYADPNDGNSTLYDLNSIPLGAIERVEILKDGASAVYGSDAIGGVINFITKSNYQGREVSVRASANDEGRYRRTGASLFAGAGDLDADGYNVFITADVSQRDRVKLQDATDIDYDLYKTLSGRFATPYGSTVSAFPVFYKESAPGSKNFAVSRANMASRLVVNTNCDPSRQLTGSTAMGLPASSVFVGRTFCNYDTNQFLDSFAGGKDGNVMSRGVFKLGGGVRAFAEAAYARSERNYNAAPIAISFSPVNNFMSTGLASSYQTILPVGHPDNPFPDARASVAYRFENGRGGNKIVNDNYRLLTGLQGSAFNWDWESAILYNENKKNDTAYGRLYLPTLNKLNAGTSLAQLAADPTLLRDTTSDDRASILQWDVKANTQFGQLGGGAMGLAVGAEVRREKIKMAPDPALASGQIYGMANAIIDGQRDVKSAFVELRTPFLKNFEMDFAGRADKYPGIKTNFVPKVGAKWTVTDSLALRSTFSRGFRAPALSQVIPGGSQFFLNGLYDPKRCETDEQTPKPGGATETDCNKNVAGTGGANPNLVPEKSKSITFGILFSPTRNLDLSLDFYKIRKEGEVALGSASDALKNEDRNPGNVARDTNPVNLLKDANGNPIPGTGPLLMVREPWINQGLVEVKGVDIDVAFRKNLGEFGNFSAKLASSYMQSYKLQQSPGAPVYNLAGYNVGVVDWSLNSSLDLPRWKSSLLASLTRGDHSFSMNVNYVGPVSMLRKYDGDTVYDQPFCHFGAAKPTDGARNRAPSQQAYESYFPDCSIKEWVTVGAGYTYTGFKNLTLTFNVQNLFDTPAPYAPLYAVNTSTTAALAGYSPGLHNSYGRYFTVSARYAF
jgi:iron complex outermembrane receptor protein